MVLAWHAAGLLDSPTGEDRKPAQSAALLPELLKRAEKGDAVAEYEISQAYTHGSGLPQNPQEGQKWLARAARHGNVQAQYEYGIALRDGFSTVQDYQAARKWIQLAAEGSNASAQYALGQIYRTGLGVPIDNAKAYVWLNVAAARGVPGAVGARDVVLSKLSASELLEAQAEARRISEGRMASNAPPPQ